VHGMSHGGWAWDAMRVRLEEGGHRVVAPDLPSHGRQAPSAPAPGCRSPYALVEILTAVRA
jgi:pimeloyl-ACP methyl ester carboxylesterase